jgi:hypothetical protein
MIDMSPKDEWLYLSISSLPSFGTVNLATLAVSLEHIPIFHRPLPQSVSHLV